MQYSVWNNEMKEQSMEYCQAQVQVPNPLSQQAPNSDPKVRPSLKNPKTQFFGLGWHNNHKTTIDSGSYTIDSGSCTIDSGSYTIDSGSHPQLLDSGS